MIHIKKDYITIHTQMNVSHQESSEGCCQSLWQDVFTNAGACCMVCDERLCFRHVDIV